MIILDVEASSLAMESYPIEIAWCHHADPNRYDSFLICPPDHWTDWDDYAEGLHGISQDELIDHGIEPYKAIQRLSVLEGGVVYTDHPGTDADWLIKLYREGGYSKIPFEVREITTLLHPEKTDAFYRRLGSMETPHRALDDARAIAMTLNYFKA